MADLIGGLWLTALNEAKGLLTSSKGEIDALDWIFKLHCHITLVFLLLSSGILQVAQVVHPTHLTTILLHTITLL